MPFLRRRRVTMSARILQINFHLNIPRGEFEEIALSLAGAVMAHPALSDLTAKQFDVIDECTAVTRGPVG